MHCVRGIAFLALGVLSLTACGGDDDGDNPGESCTPGRVETCPCPGGESGTQTCQSDGTFGACDCEPADGPDAAPVGTDECADGTDDCDQNATCTDTPESFTCACNEGYVGDGTECEADIDSFVADVSPRTIPVEIDGLGTYEITGLSRVGGDIEVTEIPISPGVVDKVPGTVSYADITMRAITSEISGQVTTLADWIDNPQQRTVTMTLTGLLGDELALTMTGTPVGGDSTITDDTVAELVLEVSALDATYTESATERPTGPLPGIDVQVEGVVISGSAFQDIVVPSAGTTDDIVWRNLKEGEEAVAWWNLTVDDIGTMGDTVRRVTALLTLDGSGTETDRVNVFETFPFRINFFNPLRAYGTTFLLDLHIANEQAQAD